MHKDTQEALERLEKELLADEKRQISDDDLDLLLEGILFDEDPEEIPATIRAYNTDRVDVDLDGYSDEVLREPKESAGELILSVITLTLIAGVMIFWAVSML